MKSFISVSPDSHFPIQNIPFGIFRTKDNPLLRAATAIGSCVVDLSVLEEKNFFADIFGGEKSVFKERSLNRFMALGKKKCSETRLMIQNLLDESNPLIRDDKDLRSKCIISMQDVEMCLPVEIGDYTDFYSSRDHATNVGIMFRGKENALMPNWLHLPVAYHGRSGSVVVSGTEIIRPMGQTKPDDSDLPVFGETKQLDFELETGFFIGTGSKLGEPISINDAEDHIFGMVLVNDWSARDIQKWEYVPLGPFLAKNFATSISPWVVTLDALEPFRMQGYKQDPVPLPYLQSKGGRLFDIKLEVKLIPSGSNEAVVISNSNAKYLYWDICQQLAHHTVNGCNMRTGDLLASGTISGPERNTCGSMLEITWRGTEPVKLPDGSERKFLQDGDTLIISGVCENGNLRVGFGEVSGKILPAVRGK